MLQWSMASVTLSVTFQQKMHMIEVHSVPMAMTKIILSAWSNGETRSGARDYLCYAGIQLTFREALISGVEKYQNVRRTHRAYEEVLKHSQ